MAKFIGAILVLAIIAGAIALSPFIILGIVVMALVAAPFVLRR